MNGLVLDSFDGPYWALLIAYITVFMHMLTGFQIFAQTTFNTAESHLKWWLFSRGLSDENKPPLDAIKEECQEGEDPIDSQNDIENPSKSHDMMTYSGDCPMQSPFDQILSQGREKAPATTAKIEHKVFGFDHIHLEPIENRMSSRMSTKNTGRSSLMNVDFSSWLPPGTTGHTHSTKRQQRHELIPMFSADTGLADEDVPLNEEGLFVPLKYRIVVRSAIILLISLIACIMPFFSAFVGLLGAVTFYPLAIHFPFACYRKVYKVSKTFSIVLYGISVCILIVGILSVIGSVRTIVIGWGSYVIFG